MTAQEQLQRDYERVFEQGQTLDDPSRRLTVDDAERDASTWFVKSDYWSRRRKDHLPLTLEVLREAGAAETLRYGRGGTFQHATDPLSDSAPRVLLLVAGYSEEQLALCIATHVRFGGCQQVVPITTRECWRLVRETVHQSLHDLQVYEVDLPAKPLEVVANDPADIFRKINGWLRANPQAAPAIDATGGQKPMDAGALQVAAYHDVPAYYLDFAEYDREARRPKPYSCVYRPLPVPDRSFSLRTREQIREAFRGRNFDRAARLTDEMLAPADGTFQLSEGSHEQFERARDLCRQCDDWMQVKYAAKVVADLRAYAENLQADRTQRTRLLEYVVDEYWRLESQFREAGNPRDALLGAAGLAELVIDSLFRFPWFDTVTVTAIGEREWVKRDEPTERPTDEQLQWVGQPLPLGRLPPGSLGSKIKLLKKGKSDFTVWALPSGNSAVLDFEGRLEEKSARLEATVECAGKSPLQAQSNRVWEQVWDGAIGVPNGKWYQVRHALVHVRVPYPQDLVDLDHVFDESLSRLIELLFRLVDHEQDGTTASIDLAEPREQFVRWKSRENGRWSRERRVPWHDREAELAQWLELPEAGGRT